MDDCLFSKDDLKPEKKYEYEIDFMPKKQISTAKEPFKVLDKERERLNELKIHKKAISKYVSGEIRRLGLLGKEKLTYGEISKILNIDIKSIKMIEEGALKKLSILLKDKEL